MFKFYNQIKTVIVADTVQLGVLPITLLDTYCVSGDEIDKIFSTLHFLPDTCVLVGYSCRVVGVSILGRNIRILPSSINFFREVFL